VVALSGTVDGSGCRRAPGNGYDLEASEFGRKTLVVCFVVTGGGSRVGFAKDAVFRNKGAESTMDEWNSVNRVRRGLVDIGL
jgi:hypothetical protein